MRNAILLGAWGAQKGRRKTYSTSQVQKLVAEGFLRLSWDAEALTQLPTEFVHDSLLGVFLVPSIAKGASLPSTCTSSQVRNQVELILCFSS